MRFSKPKKKQLKDDEFVLQTLRCVFDCVCSKLHCLERVVFSCDVVDMAKCRVLRGLGHPLVENQHC